MYKDKEKQKEANRKWAEKQRLKVVPLEVVPEKVVPIVVPESSTVKPTRHWNQAVDLPGDENYKGCCYQENGDWKVGQGTKPIDLQDNKMCNKTMSQELIHRRNELTMQRLRETPYADLKASGTWIPAWREEQERMANGL